MLHETFKVGLIGVGHRSKLSWLQVLTKNQNLELSCIVDNDKEALANINNILKKKEVHKFNNVDQCIQKINCNELTIDCFIIATPPSTHFSLSKKLIEAGIHHLVETPFTDNLEDAMKLRDLAKGKNIKVTVAENYVANPKDILIKKFMQEEKLGKLVRIVSYQDHSGFHNTARWINLIGIPDKIEALGHQHLVNGFDEFFQSRYYFSGNTLINDVSGDFKQEFARIEKPGYLGVYFEHGSIIFHSNWKEYFPRWINYLIDMKLPFSYKLKAELLTGRRKNIKSEALRIRFKNGTWASFGFKNYKIFNEFEIQRNKFSAKNFFTPFAAIKILASFQEFIKTNQSPNTLLTLDQVIEVKSIEKKVSGILGKDLEF